MNSFFTKLKEIFSIANLKKKLSENSKLIKLVVLVVVLVAVLVVGIKYAVTTIIPQIKLSAQKAKEKQKIMSELVEEPVKPQEPHLNDNYYQFGNYNGDWSLYDTQIWFTTPDDTLKDQVHEVNDKIIDSMMEKVE